MILAAFGIFSIGFTLGFCMCAIFIGGNREVPKPPEVK